MTTWLHPIEEIRFTPGSGWIEIDTVGDTTAWAKNIAQALVDAAAQPSASSAFPLSGRSTDLIIDQLAIQLACAAQAARETGAGPLGVTALIKHPERGLVDAVASARLIEDASPVSYRTEINRQAARQSNLRTTTREPIDIELSAGRVIGTHTIRHSVHGIREEHVIVGLCPPGALDIIEFTITCHNKNLAHDLYTLVQSIINRLTVRVTERTIPAPSRDRLVSVGTSTPSDRHQSDTVIERFPRRTAGMTTPRGLPAYAV
jgi:hypothetical protein